MAKTKDANGNETDSKAGTRVVYTDKPSPVDANRSISTSVSPMLYDAFVERVGALKGTGDLNGRPILQDGALAQAIREALAEYSNYDYSAASGNLLVLTKGRESNKTVQARGVVKSMFSALRARLDFDSSVATARGMLAVLGVSLTEQEFADLWDEAAA